MNVRDIFRRNTYQFIFDKYNSLPFAAYDPDWKTTPDLDIVLNKLCKGFISGRLVVIDDDGNVADDKKVPSVILSPNLLIPDYLTLFYRFLYLLKKYGVSWLYFKKSSYYLLENSNCDIDYNKHGIFNATSFLDLIRRFKYTTNGKTYDLLSGDGEIVPIFDIGYSHDDYSAISRSLQIKEILKLSNGGIEALQGAFNRISMMLLSPDNDSNGMNMVRVAKMTDKEALRDNEKFNNNYSVKKNAISVLNKSYKSLDTNPDNKKLDAPNSLNFAAERICNQYDYPYKLFRGETKFDDAEFMFSTLYLQALQPEADKLLKTITENLNIKEKVRMDYSKVLEQTVSAFNRNKNKEDNTSTEAKTE